ncbi:hypothetical protein ACJX0J_007501 [Zea mays]
MNVTEVVLLQNYHFYLNTKNMIKGLIQVLTMSLVPQERKQNVNYESMEIILAKLTKIHIRPKGMLTFPGFLFLLFNYLSFKIALQDNKENEDVRVFFPIGTLSCHKYQRSNMAIDISDDESDEELLLHLSLLGRVVLELPVSKQAEEEEGT